MKSSNIIFAIMFVALTLTSLSAWSHEEAASHATAAARETVGQTAATVEHKTNREPNSTGRHHGAHRTGKHRVRMGVRH